MNINGSSMFVLLCKFYYLRIITLLRFLLPMGLKYKFIFYSRLKIYYIFIQNINTYKVHEYMSVNKDLQPSRFLQIRN